MCGISGVWQSGKKQFDPQEFLVNQSLPSIRHRGPDDTGIWDSGNGLYLGHQRLSIIDISSAGHQPMFSNDKDIVLVFNGEIFNFLELRQELSGLGHTFRSHSDSEVLIAGYAQWDISLLDRLVGQFAFAIWDAQKARLFLARDRAGEKPLHYIHTHGLFAFCSELQGLKGIPGLPLQLDQEAVELYLQYNYVPSPHTVYKEIKKLPPAHAMTVENGKVTKIWRYWDPVNVLSRPRYSLSEPELLEELDKLISDAVRLQMIADVPLGAFLSGGIDSSLVVGHMAKLGCRPLKTFTIGFDDPQMDESNHAEAVAKHLGTEHHLRRFTHQEALDMVMKFPAQYGEPTGDTSILPTKMVAAVAREHVTVSLSGDGGDEAFGGYRSYELMRRRDKIRGKVPWFFSALRPFGHLATGKLARNINFLADDGRTSIDQVLTRWNPKSTAKLVGKDKATRYAEVDRCWAGSSQEAEFRRLMLVDLMCYMPEDVLAKVDRATMTVSLESRAPLLDHRILEFSLQVPNYLLTNKHLLRTLAYRHVPREILDRPKQGFSVPVGKWLRKEMVPLAKEAFRSSALERVGITNSEYVNKVLDEHISGAENHDIRLWTVLVLSLWGEANLA